MVPGGDDAVEDLRQGAGRQLQAGWTDLTAGGTGLEGVTRSSVEVEKGSSDEKEMMEMMDGVEVCTGSGNLTWVQKDALGPTQMPRRNIVGGVSPGHSSMS